MKKILFFSFCIIGLLIALFFAEIAFAQTTSQKTPEQIAKEHGVTFPISDLGNCKNFSECRNFCDDPVNKNACITFAKKKGFYKQSLPADAGKEEILNAAKTELGCNSPSSCQVFCSQESNHEKCEAFAKSHKLSQQPTDPSKSQILEKAKTILGCDSPTSCKNFCEQEQNRQKCSDFAKQVGLRGGEHKAGPGGCNSEETCRKFCSDPANFEICSKFGSATGGNFQGPGGCNNEASCKDYCEKNPNACQHIGGTSKENLVEFCNKTPDCSWTGSTCQCQGTGGVPGGQVIPPSEYCRLYPEKCINQSSGGINPQDYCKQYPERCRQGSPYPYPSGSAGAGGYQDYASQCSKQPGCSWTGTTCQCSGTSGSTTFTTPVPTSGTTTSTPPPTTTSTTSQTPDPATECVKHIGCSWTGTTCTCQAVQGASTQRSLFQTILQTLLRL